MERDEELVFDLRRAYARAEREARQRRQQRIIAAGLGLAGLGLFFALALGWLS
jgi:hypothetical protein